MKITYNDDPKEIKPQSKEFNSTEVPVHTKLLSSSNSIEVSVEDASNISEGKKSSDMQMKVFKVVTNVFIAVGVMITSYLLLYFVAVQLWRSSYQSHEYKDATSCPQDFNLQDGQCLYVNTKDTLYWEDARQACCAKGASLLVPADINDFKTFADTKYKSKQFWLGASDRVTEGEWIWLNGEPLQHSGFPWSIYKKWVEPNNLNNEDCLMYPFGNGAFNDEGCNRKKYHYICEACPTNYNLAGPECLSCNNQTKLTWKEASNQFQANEMNTFILAALLIVSLIALTVVTIYACYLKKRNIIKAQVYINPENPGVPSRAGCDSAATKNI